MPEITTTDLPDAIEDVAYEAIIEVDDFGIGETFMFELMTGPEWLTIDANTGVFSGTPQNDDVGVDIAITVKVTGDKGFVGEASYSIDVINVNDSPVIVTITLPDAIEGELYSEIIETIDPDEGDSTIFDIIEASQWLTIDDTGKVKGTPAYSDVGEGISVRIMCSDKGGLADTLTTSINVIHVPKPPVIITTELLDAMVGIEYSDTVEVEYLEIDGDITFEILVGPEWLTIDNGGVLSGTPALGDAGDDIPVLIRVVNESGLADTLSTVLTVHENPVLDTYIAFDLVFQNAGYQGGGSIINNPGPDEWVGFAVYLKNNTLIRGFTIDLTWDGAKASYRTSQSGPEILDDIYDINGMPDVEFAEETNILLSDGTGALSSIVGYDEAGRYNVSWAKMGGEPVTLPEGLLYLAVFKTTNDFSTDDWMTISVDFIVSDDKGNEYPLQGKVFKVGSEIAPPSNVTVTDIPGDQGHGMKITWTLSQDDNVITHYNIYRSRFPYFTDPIPFESLNTLDELISAEQNSTILIESVPRGETTFIDMSMLVSGVEYYYWLQAISENGVSEKVAGRNQPTAVESIPTGLRLNVPYPNPFNPTTTIEYYLSQEAHVILSIYNVSVQKVAVLKDGIGETGYHSVVWDAMGMPSGLYFCTLKTDQFTDMKKMLLLK